jgi:hypothetical protein
LHDTLVAEQDDALLIASNVSDYSNQAASAKTRFYQFLTEASRCVPTLNIVIAARYHGSLGRIKTVTPCRRYANHVGVLQGGGHSQEKSAVRRNHQLARDLYKEMFSSMASEDADGLVAYYPASLREAKRFESHSCSPYFAVDLSGNRGRSLR